MPWTKYIPTFLLLTIIVGATSCSSKKTLPNDGPTMVDVYDGDLTYLDASQALPNDPNYRPRNDNAQYPYDLEKYTSVGVNELENHFVEVPNPTLYLYIRHHISENGLPVPGYTTKIKMYETTHYALPGEVR